MSCILATCPGTDGREGRCWRLKTPTSKPRHILRRLGSGLDSVDGVKAVFLERTSRLS